MPWLIPVFGVTLFDYPSRKWFNRRPFIIFNVKPFFHTGVYIVVQVSKTLKIIIIFDVETIMEKPKMKKKLNLKITLGLMLFALVVAPAFAQPGQGQGQGQRRQMSEDDVKQRVERLADTLKLSEQQEKEVLDVELKFYKDIQKERANFNPETGDREAMRAKMMEMRKEVDTQYKKILDADQYAKYSKMMEERRSRRRPGRGQGQGEDSEGERGRGRGRTGGGG
jgi:hypothetical protein